MSIRESLQGAIRQITQDDFEAIALQLFRYQSIHNGIYKKYLHYLGISPQAINSIVDIPFMPIGFFKRHAILTNAPIIEATFESSGTTGNQTSRHHVADLDWYKEMSLTIFQQAYGSLTDFHLLALLPSYLERNNSSLVYMVQHFIAQTHSQVAGFFLENKASLLEALKKLNKNPDGRKVILWGVTFALLDLAENENLEFLQETPNLIVMETGGMKGRRREMLREEVHEILTKAFSVNAIHSEYGMTELLSQSYSKGNGVFEASPTMRILLRDLNDPRHVIATPKPGFRYGGINVIDLANIDSCAFIETQDLGRYVGNDSMKFEVIGRFDNSDVRGCNLLI